MIKNKGRKNGFTLLELVLVVALIAITSAIVAPVYFSAKSADDLDNSANALASSLRKAQLLSMAIEGDSSWGVKLIDENIIVFKGIDYLSRDSSWDEVFKVNKNINSSGLEEIVFSKLYGRPSLNGNIILTDGNKNKTLNINSLGVIEY